MTSCSFDFLIYYLYYRLRMHCINYPLLDSDLTQIALAFAWSPCSGTVMCIIFVSETFCIAYVV